MIVLFPTELEAARLRTARPDIEIVICGVGMAEAAATMAQLALQRNDIDEVLLAGIAGSYDTQKVAIGSVVEVIVEQIEELPERYAKRYITEPRWGLPTAVANSVNRSNAPHQTSDIESMEGASLIAICNRAGVRVSQIRAVSNRVGAPFNEWSIDLALDNLTSTLTQLL